MTKISREDATSLLGEGIHTGLRKAVDSHESVVVWQAINRLPDDEWHTVLVWLVDALASMGYHLVKEDKS